MEPQHTTQSIGTLETVFDGKLEQAVDGDITLPEYYPDILRVLKITVLPAVHAVQAAGERVTVDGSALVNVLYAAEDGTLQSYEQSYPFSRAADIPGLAEGAALTATAKTEFANGRAVSQRRLDIHGMLRIGLRVCRRQADSVLTGVNGGGMQSQGGTVRLSSLEALQSLTFPLSEVIEVEAGAPPADQILLRRATAIPTEVKAIKNKLLVKGNLETNVIYRSRGSKEPVKVTHNMPISQILEAPGVSEATENALRLVVNSLEVTPKADAGGAARLFEIAARIGAEVKGFAPVELPVVQDAYSTRGGVTLESRRLDTRQLIESFRETFAAKESFEIAGGLESVQLLTGELLPPEITIKDDALHAAGKVKLHVIYQDKEGQLRSTDLEMPYALRRARKRAGEQPHADVCLELLQLQESVGGGSLEVRAELAASGEIYALESRRVVGAVNHDESEEPPQRSPLTIYFSQIGESLWDIAKRYRTTVDAIRRENELGGEAALEGQMLLIQIGRA
ncbi:MAG: DUF3794 domain-containing protein, partial [Oscillospiraceae bacterium]|nr:DUF3794 domain-containing protein [Oscillospiraceae bacterium]